MLYGAIDLHKQKSEIRIVTGEGALTYEERIRTTRSEFIRVFRDRGPLTVLVESSTESEWVAQTLEAAGHTVVVADPSYLPMYGQRSRAIKTDRRDVAALAHACRLGLYRRAHRVSVATRDLRRQLQIRRTLIEMRTRLINQARSFVRQEGFRLPSGTAATITGRLAALALPAPVHTVLAPVRTMLDQIAATLKTIDDSLHARATTDAVAQRLMSAPGVGPVVALSFQAALETPARFGGSAARVSAYLGLVPSEDSSAERRLRGHITKQGPREMRALLVQASWTIWRSPSADAAPLRQWAHDLAARRGRRIAIVALARRLSRILFALWRDNVDFRPSPSRAATAATV